MPTFQASFPPLHERISAFEALSLLLALQVGDGAGRVENRDNRGLLTLGGLLSEERKNVQLVNLPDPNQASLPTNYEAARNALTECSKLDECKDWSDKAMALASYAKQADDESLKKLSIRIQARAIRRCGELLKEIEPGHGANQNISGGAPTIVTRKAAAEEAGLSRDQKNTAIRVANVPEHEFEAMVESDNPPTVTELAEKGKQRRTVLDLGGATHEQFVASSQIIGMLNNAHSLLSQHKPEEVVAGMNKPEKKKIKKTIEEIGEWINNFYQLL